MTRCCVFGLILLTAIGCKREEAPPSRPAATPSEPVAAPVPAEPSPEPSIGEPDSPPAAAESPDEVEPVDPAPSPGAGPPARLRDLASELSDAVGNPVDCMRDYRPASATTVEVRINAIVRPTGMIIEPSASGPGLSTNDRRCIEERVGAVVLEPLDGEASQPVATSIALRYEPAAALEAYDVAPPPAPAKNVVQPLPKKEPIAPSGVPIKGPAADPIEGPEGVPIDGPKAVPIEGPEGVPIGSE